MSVVIVACDRCGEHAEVDSRSLIHVATSPVRGLRPAYDLCRPCAAELARWLETPRQPDTVWELAMSTPQTEAP